MWTKNESNCARAVHGNGQLPNAHFHKDWQRRVKTWFNQPGRKLRRRQARKDKAARVAPRPVDALRPAVRPPTAKYNYKIRAGRGFTFEELKAAGISRKVAPTIGIAVDHRRRNRSEESLARNVERLQAYKARLVVLPSKKQKAAYKEAAAGLSEVAQASVANEFPIEFKPAEVEFRAITDEEKSADNYHSLRVARSIARHTGAWEAAKKRAAEEEAAKKK